MKSSMNYNFTSRHLTLDSLPRSNQGHKENVSPK